MLRVIIDREFRTLLFSRANIISIAVVVAIFLGAGVVGRFLLNDADTPEVTKFAVTTQTAPLEPLLREQGVEVENVGETTPEEVFAREDAPDAVIGGTAEVPHVYTNSRGAPSSQYVEITKAATVGSLLRQSNISPDIQSKLLAAESLSSTDLTEKAAFADTNFFGVAAGVIGASIILFVTMSGVNGIPVRVVEEKSSRVVEIILTTVKPSTLLLGKVLGVGGAVLVTNLTYIVGALAAVYISGIMPSLGLITEVGIWPILLNILIWVVFGYFIMAAFAGGIASMVSRQEDLSGPLSALIFAALIPFYAAVFGLQSSIDATWYKVLSFVPGFSQYFMPIRFGANQSGWSEQLIAYALAGLAVILLSRLGAIIYERSILRIGERVKLSQIFRKAA